MGNKKGKNSEVIPVRMRKDMATVDDAFLYYNDLLKSASIDKFILRYAFDKTSQVYDQQFDSFVVDEVGYKLSKRKEKSMPNQLCTFVGNNTKKKFTICIYVMNRIQLVMTLENQLQFWIL